MNNDIFKYISKSDNTSFSSFKGEELEDLFDEAIESVRECAVDSDSFFTKDLTNEITELYNIEERLKDVFRPEFLNRVDEIVVFDSLTKEQLLQIVDLLLKSTAKALENKDIKLEVSNEAKNFVLEKGTDLKYGARPLRRAIQRYIEDEISDLILRQEVESGQTIFVNFDGEKLVFNIQ